MTTLPSPGLDTSSLFRAINGRPSQWPRVVALAILAFLAGWVFWLGQDLGMAWLCAEGGGTYDPRTRTCEQPTIHVRISGGDTDGNDVPPRLTLPPGWPGGGA